MVNNKKQKMQEIVVFSLQ